MTDELLNEPLVIEMEGEEPFELDMATSRFIVAEAKRLNLSLEDTLAKIITEALPALQAENPKDEDDA